MNWNRYSIFKLPNKHRRFEYVPRYYDARKEELEKKIKRAEAEATTAKNNQEGITERREISFRERTSDKWGNTEFKSKMMSANIRLIIIFVIALLAFFYLFQYLGDIGTYLDEQTGK